MAVIFASAMIVLAEVIARFFHPQTPTHLWALLVAGLIGVAGNEIAAVIRWRAGRRLDSAALTADGNHARADGYVSGGMSSRRCSSRWACRSPTPSSGC